MNFRVNYLATDGNIRHVDVNAETAEEAETIALEEDAKVSACGDNILSIVSVE